MNNDEIFQGLASFKRWVPFKITFNPKRGKYDKIPHNGRNGISTAEPDQWMDLVSAVNVVNEQYGISGVGFVMTGGIELEGWTLVGFDFDDVTPEWKQPFKTYAEKSPSKTGIRMFAWVPSDWAKQFQDTLDTTPPGCAHCEIYLGTAPRFLTVTFEENNATPISTLTGKDLLTIESWGMHLYEAPKPVSTLPTFDVPGQPLDLTNKKFKFTKDQQHLVMGTGDIDRSKVMMGFLVKLIDFGITREDILATMLTDKALLQYLMDHRNNNEDKAVEFAKEEIDRAYGKSIKGKREALIGFNEKWKVVEKAPKKDDLSFPMELYTKAPGLVGDIAKWIMGVSYTPREEFAYAAALSMVACLVGPYCTHGSRNGKLNLYIALVGETGTGKNEAIDGMGLLLSSTDAMDCMSDFPASEAALRRQLNITPNILIRIDELAHKFQGMADNSSGSSMGRAILEAYNAVRMPPKPYADGNKSLPAVENPFVQILGGTTDKVWDVLKSSHLDDGTLNRFIFVCLQDDPPYSYNPKPNANVPKILKDKLNTFWRAGKMSDLIGDMPGFGRHITYSADVEIAAEELNHAAWLLQKGEFGNLYSRYVQSTMKIASILAIGDGRDVVGIKDFEQAVKFMRWSATNTAKKVDAYMASTNYERLSKRLLAYLEKCGGRVPMRDAYKFMHIYRREMEELTSTLVLSGQIDMDVEEGGKEWLILL